MIKHLMILLTCLMAAFGSLYCQEQDYVLNIGDFTELTVYDNVNVIYKSDPDSAGFASFHTTPQLAHVLTFTNTKGKIKIEVISDDQITDQLPTLTIYSSTLSKATNLADSTIVLEKTNPCEKLSLKIMGNGCIQALDVYTTNFAATAEAGSGHIFVNGKTQDAKMTIAGSGVIEARTLEASKAQIWMFGTGSIDCSVEKSMSIYGMGSGSLYYSGSPKIKKRNIGVKVISVD